MFARFALLLAAGSVVSAPVTVKYRIEQKIESKVDLSGFGQGEQVQNQGAFWFVTITYSDSAGGSVVHAVLDSARLDAMMPTITAATIDSAKGTAYHGYLDAERPDLSALVFSMVNQQGQPQDGFLRAHEIYNLSLPAELVVLSACDTGLGKEIKGEGLVGLTRAFMYAGAARVGVSLWSVSDKATADLMHSFYQAMLQRGERPAAALRSAQLEMRARKSWSAPYYWAAFILQGEWQ